MISHPTTRWQGSIVARSSIAHAGETRGTITLLRRERIATPDGLKLVPVISGNTLRGRLRRVGEELLRDHLAYAGSIPPAAAHALRGGGALAKSSAEPLSGNRLRRLRELVPQIGVFGTAAGGTIIDGALMVGKVLPIVTETARITGEPSDLSAFKATQLEAYTRQDDSQAHDFHDVFEVRPPTGPSDATTGGAPSRQLPEPHIAGPALTFEPDGQPIFTDSSSRQMLFNIETFPSGTRFATWVTLRRPTDLVLSFFTDVLATYSADARLGGRIAIGHGDIDISWHVSPPPTPSIPWREVTEGHREEILALLTALT